MQWPTTDTSISNKHWQIQPGWRFLFACSHVNDRFMLRLRQLLYSSYQSIQAITELNQFYLQSASTIFRVWTCCLWAIYHISPPPYGSPLSHPSWINNHGLLHIIEQALHHNSCYCPKSLIGIQIKQGGAKPYSTKTRNKSRHTQWPVV